MKTNATARIAAMSLLAALATPVRLAAQELNPQQRRYKLVDLGTLGGPASYLASNAYAFNALNDRGIVAGTADTPIPDP